MARLTDTQRIILSAASQREDRGVELPANVQGKAAGKIVDKLIRAGLLEEVRASGSLPVWRRDDESGAIALRITSAGLAAIDAADEAMAAPEENDGRLATAKSRDPPETSPPASGCPFRHGSPLARGIAPVRRRLRPACSTTAGRARSKLGCWRCWADQKERPLPPSCGRPIGSSIRCAAFSPVWCAKSSASIFARRRATVTGSIASSTLALPADVSRGLSAMPRVVIDSTAGERGPRESRSRDLRGLDLGGLRARWHTVFRRRAPPHLPRHLLFRILAYRLQADRLGDLDADSRRLLDRIGSEPVDGIGRLVGDLNRCRTELRPGTLLTREWDGQLQRVRVLADGFSWNGQTYRSLSKVAFAITGARWNGPRFFGLRDRAPAEVRS